MAPVAIDMVDHCGRAGASFLKAEAAERLFESDLGPEFLPAPRVVVGPLLWIMPAGLSLRL